MKAKEWGALLNREKVDEAIKESIENIFKYLDEENINLDVVTDLCEKVINNNTKTDREKLFILNQFEDLIIKSKICSTAEVIEFGDNYLRKE